MLNGPNLGRLGRRDPAVYGSRSHEDLAVLCHEEGQRCGVDVEVRQTDVESDLLGWLHEAADSGAAVVINAAAWTHTSIAVRDAADEVSAGLVEVHLSNVFARDDFRQHSYLSGIATAVIAGLGFDGYAAAIRFLASR